MVNVELATLEQIRDELAAADRQADELRERLESEIVAAVPDARIVDIAGAAGMSRPHVYRVLRRHGVAVDSEMGRNLVAKRWRQARDVEKIGPQPSADLDRYIGERRDLRAVEQGEPLELFDPPLDGPPEEELSIIEFAERMMARRNAR